MNRDIRFKTVSLVGAPAPLLMFFLVALILAEKSAQTRSDKALADRNSYTLSVSWVTASDEVSA